MKDATPLQRRLMARGALLFFLSLLTGVFAGAVMTDGRAVGLALHFTPSQQKLALVAHLNALLGCFWLIAVAVTLEATRYADAGKERLARAATVIAFANWAVTLLASLVDRKGLEIVKDDAKNNLVAILLLGLVVIPGLATSAAWAYGFLGGGRPGRPPASPPGQPAP
jgi:SNF family Na+-dependent transporter